jgi:hypothetical protein
MMTGFAGTDPPRSEAGFWQQETRPEFGPNRGPRFSKRACGACCLFADQEGVESGDADYETPSKNRWHSSRFLGSN